VSLYFLYKPRVGGDGAIVPPPIDEGDPSRFFAGGSISRDARVIHSVKDPRANYVKALKGYFSEVREWLEGEREEELEQELEELSELDSPEDIEELRVKLQGLAATLTQLSKKVEASLPPRLLEIPVELEAIGPSLVELMEQYLADQKRKRESDEEDEILLMMMLQ
jgi:hypothetical protein